MALKFKIKAKTGTYTDKQGQQKNAYREIGAVFEKEGQLSAKLETIPVGWDGFMYLNVPEERPAQGQGGGGASGSIPF